MIRTIAERAACKTPLGWIHGTVMTADDGTLFVHYDGEFHGKPQSMYVRIVIRAYFEIWGAKPRKVMVAAQWKDLGEGVIVVTENSLPWVWRETKADFYSGEQKLPWWNSMLGQKGSDPEFDKWLEKEEWKRNPL